MSQPHSRSTSLAAHTGDTARSGAISSPNSMIASSAKKPTVFDLQPPLWRPRLHPGSRQLGAPDIHIRGVGGSTAPEDELTEANVKNGISARPAVGNETFSAHEMIYDRLKGKSVVNQLGFLFDEVVHRREQLASLRCGPASSTYRQPQRVTLNEVKLAAYVKELADASVPLRKLARSVPHGYRGERMLDMLWNGGNAGHTMAAAVKGQSASVSAAAAANSSSSVIAAAPSTHNLHGLPNSVAIDRAVWFVRVVGASEMSSSRLRQGNSAAYTAEWTGVLMGWLRRQIVELNVAHHHPQSQLHYTHTTLGTSGTPNHKSPASSSSAAHHMRVRPSVPTPQPTPPQLQQQLRSTGLTDEEPYAMFLEDDFRDRWLAKWRYSVSLLRALRYESLIDVQVAAHAALDMLRTANVVQIVIVLAMLQEFLDVITDSVTLRHFAVDVLSSKLQDYRAATNASASDGSYGSLKVCKELNYTLLYIADTSPDALISPSCWTKIQRIIEEDVQDATARVNVRIANVKNRNERLLFGFLASEWHGDTASSMSEHLRDVQILDEFILQQDVLATFDALFRGRPASTSSEGKIRTILSWSTTQWRSGEFRTCVGATLIQRYVKLQPSRTTQKRSAPSALSVLHTVHQRGQTNGGGGESNDSGTASLPLNRIDVDAVVMSWITDSDIALRRASASGKPTDVRWRSELEAISVRLLIILLGELCRRECFSFQKYLQRLTARGLTAMGGRSSGETKDMLLDRTDGGDVQNSLHSKLLRSIPLFISSAPLEHQRRTAIYGNRSKESWEEAMERRATRELMANFTFLNDANDSTPPIIDPLTTKIQHDDHSRSLAHFWSSSRYVQSRVIYQHVLPALRQQIERRGEAGGSEIQFLHLTRLLADVQQFAALHEVLALVIEKDSRPGMRRIAQLVFMQNRLIWRSMNVRGLVERPGLANHNAGSKDSENGIGAATEAKPEMTIAETTAIARESIKAYCAGHVDDARVLLQGRKLGADIALMTILDASAEETASIDALVLWLLRLCSSIEKVEISIALCTLLNQVNSSDDSERWAKVTVRLACRDMLSIGHVIDLFVIPTIQHVSPLPASAAHSASRIRLALTLVSALVTCTSHGEEQELELQNAYLQYLDGALMTSISEVVHLICHLANAEHSLIGQVEQDVLMSIASVRQAICHNVNLQTRIQSDLVSTITAVRRTTMSEALTHSTLNDLLGSRWPWTSDHELADKSAAMTQELDAFRWRQALCEVSIAVGALQKASAAADIGARGKLQSLARLVCSHVLCDDDDAATASYSLSVLASNTVHGTSFADYLLEERVRRLGVQLEATFADEIRVQACLHSLLLMRRDFVDDGSGTPMPSTAVHVLRLVTEWMESNVTVTPGPDITQHVPEATMTSTGTTAQTFTAMTSNGARRWHNEEDESLTARLGVVCGLMQLDGLLATPSAKQLAPRLFCAILHIVLAQSRRLDATEARLTPMLDVAMYVLQQAPFDVQQTMQARALEQFASVLQLRPCPLDGAGLRIAELINHDQDSVRPLHLTGTGAAYKAWQQQRSLLIEAPSCSSAFLHGQFTPVFIKPWDLHPNVETLSGGATTTASKTADGADSATTNGAASSSSTTGMAMLTNNGPISLQQFGAHRTLDHLPDAMMMGGGKGRADNKSSTSSRNSASARPPAPLHSEQSYGVHLAGESIYARDARRGLLAMHNLSGERHADVKHLIPSLQQMVSPSKQQSTTAGEVLSKRGSGPKTAPPNGSAKKRADGAEAPSNDKGGEKTGKGSLKGKEAAATTTARKRKTSSAATITFNDKKTPIGNSRKRAKKD